MDTNAFKIVKTTRDYIQGSLDSINSLKEGLQDFERLKRVLEKHTIISFFENRPEIENFTWKYLDKPDGTIRIGAIDRYEWVLLAFDGSLCAALDKCKITKSTGFYFIYGAIFGIGYKGPGFYLNELCFDDGFTEARKEASRFFTRSEHSLEITMDELNLNSKMMHGLITTPELENLLNDCKSRLSRKEKEFSVFIKNLKDELHLEY